MILITKTSDQTRVCVCVSGRQICGRTSRGHTRFLHLPYAVLALIFIARTIQSSLSLVDREVELCVLYPQINRFLLVGPSFCDYTEIRTTGATDQ